MATTKAASKTAAAKKPAAGSKTSTVKKTVASKSATTRKTTTSKTATAKPTAAKTAASKKPATAPRTPAAAAKKSVPARPGVPKGTAGNTPTPEERYRMTQEAAYFIAERNGFAGGAMDYWVEAEAQISALLAGK
jgi:hypothetical protein